MKVRAALLVFLLSLLGCGGESGGSGQTAGSEQKVPSVSGTADPDSNNVVAESSAGINWFDGSVEQAFASAKAQNKPLFLYWGAVWCPPCHELKATVFTRPDFIAASRQFVALRIDGDDPGAQQHAEQFGVMGYPTLVIFSPRGVEQTRIPNGLDVQAYANVLQNSLDQLEPIADVMAAAVQKNTLLSAQQCQALANHSWSQDPSDFAARRLSELFSAAADKCASDALYVMALIQRQQDGEPLPEKERSIANTRLNKIVSSQSLVEQHFYLMLDAGEPLSELLATPPASRAVKLEQAFDELYAQLTRDDSRSVMLRIQALRARLSLRDATGDENAAADSNGSADSNKELPEELQSDIESMLALSKQMERKDPQFHATVNATGNLLREAGYLLEAKALLSNEIAQSKYPYYFMGDLAHVEDLLGNKDQAIVWLRKAFNEARGPATRFQWGVNYLTGLLDLDPGNQPAIDTGFSEVFAEVANSKAFYQRSRVRLQRLDKAFLDWAGSNEQRQSALRRYRNSSVEVCRTIPASDAARAHCDEFLGEA